MIKPMRTFKIFMSRYPELASKFEKSPSSMICDSVINGKLPYSNSGSSNFSKWLNDWMVAVVKYC